MVEEAASPRAGRASTPRESPRRSVVRVLLVAGTGVLLLGFAGYAVSVAMTPDQPLVHTMCLDSTCTYAMSADGAMVTPVPHRSRSAPERFVRKVLYICHIR
jgi:hypothetical protein